MKKHIVCFGDSNTHGYCADPADCADGGIRFNENERWTCLLQKQLGEEYHVLEEGLSGRTTVFPDPIEEGKAAIDYIYATKGNPNGLVMLLKHSDFMRTAGHSVEQVMTACGIPEKAQNMILV